MPKTPQSESNRPGTPPGGQTAHKPRETPAPPGGVGGSQAPGADHEFRGGFRQGATDAADAAATVLPVAARWVSRGVYGACYMAGYGAVFGALTLSRLLPADGAVLHGLRDGGAAARQDLEGHLAGTRVVGGTDAPGPRRS